MSETAAKWIEAVVSGVRERPELSGMRLACLVPTRSPETWAEAETHGAIRVDVGRQVAIVLVPRDGPSPGGDGGR